jgi:hypothetical protein
MVHDGRSGDDGDRGDEDSDLLEYEDMYAEDEFYDE